MPEQQDLNDLAYFAWVVDAGGFAPAGRRHGVPKSKLSRRIKALEERLGVRLLQRSTRRFSVTSTGETFYRHCKALLQEAEAAKRGDQSPPWRAMRHCSSELPGDLAALRDRRHAQ